MAKAPEGRVSALLDTMGARPAFTWLRAPEIGAVMLQGRTGATGAPFNHGEMTVTRASLALEDGTVGHAWVPGRDRDKAADAALADALMQRAEAGVIRETVLAPLVEAEAARHREAAEKAAATKVDFFTMVRGEG